MRKVVIDTNVILSAVLFGGNPAIILNAVQNKQFILCVSEKLRNEVFDKLCIKFNVDGAILNQVAIIMNYGRMYEPTKSVLFPQDPKDEYLLELAQECKADFLITGDKRHLLPLKKWEKTVILSPTEAVEVLSL